MASSIPRPILEPRVHRLRDGRALLIREAAVEDAPILLDYIAQVAGESDFLSFGPGEFELTESEERDHLRQVRDSDNRLYLVGLIDGRLVSTLTFSAGGRPRTRHSGEFGMSVRRGCWGIGIGSLMLDTLIDWARSNGVVTKIDLRVRTDNAGAIRLYQRKGFTVEGTISRAIYLDGTYYDHYCMGLMV